jgi:hypothetical protein
VELGFSSGGNHLIPPGHGCEITKHLKLAQLPLGLKFLCGCLKLEGLKVELGFSSGGIPLISPGREC